MKPVHELTTDEAVAELEKVCDRLAEGMVPFQKELLLEARKRELEAWILMHQGKADAPVKSGPSAALGAIPRSKEAAMTTGEGKPPHHGATATETIQENPMPWPTGKKKPPMSEETKQKIRTARAAQEAAKKALVPVEQKELGRPGCAYPRIYNRKMADLQRQILLVTAEVVALPLDERALLLESAANLDALAHQLAQFLATGRIEVA